MRYDRLLWEATPNLNSARIDHYEAWGHRYFLDINFNPHAFDDAGGWDVEIGAIITLGDGTDDSVTIDSNLLFDLHAAKLWAESVDLRALADDLAGDAEMLEHFAVESYENGGD